MTTKINIFSKKENKEIEVLCSTYLNYKNLFIDPLDVDFIENDINDNNAKNGQFEGLINSGKLTTIYWTIKNNYQLSKI